MNRVMFTLNDEFKIIRENYLRITERLAAAAEKSGTHPRLMAVTKTVPPERVNFAIELGIGLIGENRVQEYLSKKDSYKPAEMHMIGHLQSNKVKYIIEDASMIESVDSVRLAVEISRLAQSHGRVMDILCEVNIGGEESKSGFPADTAALREALCEIGELRGVRVKGLMTIPPPSDGTVYFERMKRLYDELADTPGTDMTVLSMGMSADYESAVLCGSNLVRIGSGLFGQRIYK